MHVNFLFYNATSQKFLKTRTNAPIFNIKFKIMLFFADNKKSRLEEAASLSPGGLG